MQYDIMPHRIRSNDNFVQYSPPSPSIPSGLRQRGLLSRTAAGDRGYESLGSSVVTLNMAVSMQFAVEVTDVVVAGF